MKGVNAVTDVGGSAYLWAVRAPLILLLLAAFGPLRAAAQPVLGVVVEEGRGVPVAGAMVLLFDDEGNRVDRMLTNVAGRFLLEARRGGPHYITVDRIGYASVTTDPFTPAEGAEPIRIEAPIVPIKLRGLVVSAGARCRVRPEEGEAAALVWEEARKALAAEEWTREAGLYRYTLLRYEQLMDRDAAEILSDTTMAMPDQASAFISAPIEDLVAGGFVQAEGDTATVYYAPDAAALLSEAFLDTHCLTVVDGGANLVGVAFRPAEGRTVPEIAGVLWLDAETAELQRIQFGYVNLVDDPEVGYPPGEVRLTRLPDGAWIVNDWWIRMPGLMVDRRGRARRLDYRVEGGKTASVTDARGRTVLDAWTASIFGVVADSAGTGPPPGPVLVVREGSGDGEEGEAAATGIITDADGSFLFSGLEAGAHVLRVPRTALTEMGLAEPRVTVEGGAGEVSYVRMKVPTVADALVHSCGGTPRPGGTAPVMGRIRYADGTPAGDMLVRARWPAAAGYRAGLAEADMAAGPAAARAVAAPIGPGGESGNGWTLGVDGDFVTATTTTDARGYFLLCDVPYGTRIRVAVSDPDGAEPPTNRILQVSPDRLAVVESIILAGNP